MAPNALRSSPTCFKRTSAEAQNMLSEDILNRIPVAMLMVNSAGIVRMANAEAERIFGYTRSEMLDQYIEMFVPFRFRDRHPGFRHGFFQTPDARPMGAGRDLFALHKDGSEFPVEIGLNPIETEQGLMVLSAVVDITERKQREVEIRAALNEKNLLLGEIHHRVKNNLQMIDSLLDLQSSQIDDERVRNLLRDSQNRIRSMSLIHQTLYQSRDFARVDFQRFMDSLLPLLLESYSSDSDSIKLRMDANNIQLPINTAIPCGLAVNELITNALKHGFRDGRSGQIQVDLTRESPTQLALTVSNDGAPIPEALDVLKGSTLGIQLVNLLAQQMHGSVEVHRADPVRFSMHFPYDGQQREE